MVRHQTYIIAFGAAAVLFLCGCSGKGKSNHRNEYTKQERKLINEGAKVYADSDFHKAYIAFQKALVENPENQFAQYNAALTDLQLASTLSESSVDSVKAKADAVFSRIAELPDADTLLRENSIYNSGNIAFSKEDYQRSIEQYKKILRADTANRQALENLRLAQLRLNEQQQDKNSQEQNNQDDKKDQQQDQQDQNKDQQDQNKDQQQDQNKDQQQDQQDKNKDKQDKNQKPKPENQDKKPEDRQDGSISAANAQQILDAMEKKEAATRQRVDNMKADQERKGNPVNATTKPW